MQRKSETKYYKGFIKIKHVRIAFKGLKEHCQLSFSPNGNWL